MPEYTKVWLPDFSNLPKEKTDQEKRVEARKQQARLESGVVTANDKYTGTNKERYLKAKAKIDSKGRPVAGKLTPVQDIVYAVNPLTSVLWAADEGSKALSSIPEAIKYKQYGAAIGGGLKAIASPIIGAFSFVPITQTATNAVNNYKAANQLSKTTQKLIKEQNAAEIANQLQWQPKEEYYYHVARRSKQPTDNKFLDLDGFYRMGSKEVPQALEPLKSAVGEPLIYLQRGTPRYYPEIFQNTDNVVYEIPASSIGLENGALIEKLPKVDLSKATKYEFDLSSRSYKPSKILSNNSKLTEGEILGIPKGQERFIVNNESEILQNAKSFAEKYGYDIPENIDAAKQMYRQHNRWFRTVDDPKRFLLSKNDNIFGLAEYAPELQGKTKEEIAKILASKGYPKSIRTWHIKDAGQYVDRTVFASPSMATNAKYQGNPNNITVMLQRPFTLRNPLRWHIDADYRPISTRDLVTEVGQTQIGNAGPIDEIKLGTKHLIPVKIAEPADKGTFLGEFLGNIYYKSGGKLNYTKFYK